MKKLSSILFAIIITITANSAESPTIEVVAEGMGISETKALKSAFSSAIRQAVGMYVSTEELVSKETVIKDQILTYSDAIVKDYEVLKKSKDVDGLHTVSIKAKVVRRKLIEKLGEAKVGTFKLETKGLFAKIASEQMAADDAKTLITKEFENYPGDIISIEPSGEPKVLVKGTDSHVVEFGHLVKIDQKKYENFVKRISPVLAKISTLPPESRSTGLRLEKPSVLIKSQFENTRQLQVNYLSPTREVPAPPLVEPSDSLRLPRDFSLDPQSKGYNVFVAEALGPKGSVIKWRCYRIDAKAFLAIAEQTQGSFKIKSTFLGEGGAELYYAEKSTERCEPGLIFYNLVGQISPYANEALTMFQYASLYIVPFFQQSYMGFELLELTDKRKYLYNYILSNDVLRSTQKMNLSVSFQRKKTK